MNGLITKILRIRKVVAGKDFYSRNQINIRRKTLGKKGASWTISDLGITKESIIYSFGVGTDISFDLQLIRDYHCKIHAFDPTPKSIKWLESQIIPDEFIFHPFGIAAINGKIDLFLPENDNYVSGSILPEMILTSSKTSVDVFDLISTMNMLGNRYIDILKMDIEGAEYVVIQNILDNGIDIKQILIEFHHRFPGIGVNKTKEAIKSLNAAGYKIFSVSASGEEFSFIKY
jgi:FkbM family methyltransferase